MSHDLGPLLIENLVIGPDGGGLPTTGSDTWSVDYVPQAGVEPTRFVLLHFTGVSLPGNNRLEVDLGYDTDVFTSTLGTDFWTRPINVPLTGAQAMVAGREPVSDRVSSAARIREKRVEWARCRIQAGRGM